MVVTEKQVCKYILYQSLVLGFMDMVLRNQGYFNARSCRFVPASLRVQLVNEVGFILFRVLFLKEENESILKEKIKGISGFVILIP